MKSKLAYTVLFSVFGIAAAAAAETAGVATSSIAYVVPFSTFIIAMVLLTLGVDYGRSVKPLLVTTNDEVLTPANEAFGSSHASSHRAANGRRPVRRRRRSLVVHR